jgi:tRNA (cmo5U34)-methyltransferase
MSLFRGESTVDDIRRRFDQDVERFSNLETGQSAAMDAPLALDLVTRAALAVNPRPRRVLDLGCGAGNFTLRLLDGCETVEEVVLVDLSRPMLDRAAQRIAQGRNLAVTTLQGDLRDIPFEQTQFDVILAGAVLHHLRTDSEWEQTFRRLFQATAAGGSCWIFDLVAGSHPAIQQVQWERYGQYLAGLKDEAYRDQVFAYATQEDSPRPVAYQLQLLREAGYAHVEVLHMNACFAAFGGIRASA